MQTVRKDLYCDLAIIGGGVGGCAAAICAARRGLHVMIFEKGVSLGGLATNGYVPQVAGGIEGICLEFTERLDKIGQLRKIDPSKDYYRNPSFEPEFGKFVLEDMVVQAGARVIYDSTCFDVEMDGANIKRVLFHTKGGVMGVSARMYIDATGDADVAAMAGVPYEVGGADFAGDAGSVAPRALELLRDSARLSEMSSALESLTGKNAAHAIYSILSDSRE